jgi:hypothetical protein
MDYGNGDYATYSYDKYGNIKEKYTNGTLTYQGVADNTGTIISSSFNVFDFNAYEYCDFLFDLLRL